MRVELKVVSSKVFKRVRVKGWKVSVKKLYKSESGLKEKEEEKGKKEG